MFYITKQAWKKVIDYARASYDKFSAEIGGFMIMKKDKDGDYIISEPEILKQVVTGGTTEMDKEEVSDYYIKAAEKHGNDIRFIWWHSHANMKAFWSGTDTSTMEEYKGSDWAAFLVVNIKGEHKFSVKMWNPIDVLEDVELNILGMKTVPKSITNEVEKLCSKPKITASVHRGYGGYNGNQLPLYNGVSGWSIEDQAELEAYNGSYGLHKEPNTDNLSFKDKVLLKEMIDNIDDVNEYYSDGKIEYKNWLKTVKSFNKVLKGKNVSFDMKELTKNELDSHVGEYTMYDSENFVNYGGNNESNIKV